MMQTPLRHGGNRYVLADAVGNGQSVICLECKGLTYFPPSDDMVTRLGQWVSDHELFCPALLERAIALICSAVKGRPE